MWALELLVTQLYDPAFEVCEAAAQYLETLCEDTAILEAVVRLRPTLDHLGEVGQCLLLRSVPSLALAKQSLVGLTICNIGFFLRLPVFHIYDAQITSIGKSTSGTTQVDVSFGAYGAVSLTEARPFCSTAMFSTYRKSKCTWPKVFDRR